MELWQILGEQACGYLVEEIVGTSLLGFAPKHECDHLWDELSFSSARGPIWHMNLDHTIASKCGDPTFSTS
jgi:hypothetical protein